MDDEMIFQTFLNRSDDMAELRAARAEDRDPTTPGAEDMDADDLTQDDSEDTHPATWPGLPAPPGSVLPRYRRDL